MRQEKAAPGGASTPGSEGLAHPLHRRTDLMLTGALTDQELLAIRDRLEQDREQGDTRYDWLLTVVRDEITERARQACLDAEQQ
jgi:hypothetical protein